MGSASSRVMLLSNKYKRFSKVILCYILLDKRGDFQKMCMNSEGFGGCLKVTLEKCMTQNSAGVDGGLSKFKSIFHHCLYFSFYHQKNYCQNNM